MPSSSWPPRSAACRWPHPSHRRHGPRRASPQCHAEKHLQTGHAARNSGLDCCQPRFFRLVCPNYRKISNYHESGLQLHCTSDLLYLGKSESRAKQIQRFIVICPLQMSFWASYICYIHPVSRFSDPSNWII